MDKTFNHQEYEKNIYSLWEKSGSFSPQPDPKKKPFCIIMPPPNANDNLHIGHARFITIEDILIRYYRMNGYSSLWLPGADHAGIETQFVFEKKLKEQGKNRFDYNRDTLYRMIWDYVSQNKENMEAQLRSLGASCDWKRNKFTLDPEIVKIVYKTFKKLSDEGYLYRGERIVNYCPRCGTYYSQLEVSSEEREDNLYYLDYKTISIATTRPETIFADVAVAINPNNKNLKNLIGKNAVIPIIKREIPIISDSLVKEDLGTGALKITPAHDEVDFEIGKKHNLPIITVIDSSGKMTNTPREYVGLKVSEARERVVEDLKKEGNLIKVDKIKHLVGICYRDKGIIEPLISKQWFIKTKDLAKNVLDAIDKKEVKFASVKFKKIAIHWLKNLKDWNISRQIVWGIQIPAWQCKKCFEWTVTDGEFPQSCSKCDASDLTQDQDTFDTWFSSAQWPYVTLLTSKKGVLKNNVLSLNVKSTKDFEYFYPTSVMETAYDILPFWVIRMLLMGLYATGKVPFKEVLIHGLVRDSQGQKISKSKGNVINPLEMSKIYGTDALRMGMVWGALIENDICLSEENIKGQRNFANKIWNIARYVSLKENPIINNAKSKTIDIKKENQIIKKEFLKTSKRVSHLIEKYRFNEGAEEIYDFVWHKFADVYIENTKSQKDKVQDMLEYILLGCIKLLHPFMPYVTEQIYQNLFSKGNKDLLISSSWPK